MYASLPKSPSLERNRCTVIGCRIHWPSRNLLRRLSSTTTLPKLRLAALGMIKRQVRPPPFPSSKQESLIRTTNRSSDTTTLANGEAKTVATKAKTAIRCKSLITIDSNRMVLRNSKSSSQVKIRCETPSLFSPELSYSACSPTLQDEPLPESLLANGRTIGVE